MFTKEWPRSDEVFRAYYDAEKFLKENGYSHGSMCRHEPIGVLFGDARIHKWDNLTAKEKRNLHGKLTSPDFRHGPVTLEILQYAET